MDGGHTCCPLSASAVLFGRMNPEFGGVHMRLIITGCEHVGKTTLSDGVSRWLADVTGYSRTSHDHFTVPSPEVADEDRELFMRMSPGFKERFQRYQIAYHGGGAFLSDADHLLVG